MEKTEILKVLKRLEDFRLHVESGKCNPGSPDWVIRMCQAIVAEGTFSDRAYWLRALDNAKNPMTLA